MEGVIAPGEGERDHVDCERFDPVQRNVMTGHFFLRMLKLDVFQDNIEGRENM